MVEQLVSQLVIFASDWVQAKAASNTQELTTATLQINYLMIQLDIALENEFPNPASRSTEIKNLITQRLVFQFRNSR